MFDCGAHHVPVNGLVAQVGPEDHLLVEVGIQRHRVPLLLHQLGVLLPLQAQAANVTAVGEHQARLLAYRTDGTRGKLEDSCIWECAADAVRGRGGAPGRSFGFGFNT